MGIVAVGQLVGISFMGRRTVGRSVGKNVSVGIVLYRRHFYRLIVSVGIVLCRPMVGRYSDL